jgi:hypothetical protein
MSADGTGWPLLDERPRTPPPVRRLARRARARPAWALALLAFVCGGLVSAAGFSIGWKHLAQSGTAAQTKLAAATAHVHRLDASLAAARGKERRTAARLAASARSARALSKDVASLAAQGAAAERSAGPVSDAAGAMTSAAARLASELKTLSDYLTNTPAGQIDGGYVATQIAYLTRQLTALQSSGGSLDTATAAFRSAAHRLAAQATSLSARG